MKNEIKVDAPDWLERCDDCGWPIESDNAGCKESSCSFRPHRGSDEYKRWKQGQSLNAIERRHTRNYVRQIELKLRNQSAEVSGLVDFLRLIETTLTQGDYNERVADALSLIAQSLALEEHYATDSGIQPHSVEMPEGVEATLHDALRDSVKIIDPADSKQTETK